MKHTLTIGGLAIVMAVSLFFWFDTGTVVQAQEPCETFDALGQMIIPTTNPLAPGHRWGGEVYIKMGDQYLRGLISGEDGTVVRRPNSGQGKYGRYIIGFDCVPGSPNWTCEETIEIKVPNSIFGAGAPIFSRDQANSAYIEGGTGRFEFATGNITMSGPYIVWPTGGIPPFNGRYNPEMNGHICGVQ